MERHIQSILQQNKEKGLSQNAHSTQGKEIASLSRLSKTIMIK